MKKVLHRIFFLYCLILMEILLLGRRADTSVPIAKYFALYANAIPFRTLARYVSHFVNVRNLTSFRLAFLNIGGNFVLFLPMGVLLPALFCAMKKMKNCLLTIFCVVLCAEILQGLFRVGVPDIDDLSVNMLGAYAGWHWRGLARRRSKSRRSFPFLS